MTEKAIRTPKQTRKTLELTVTGLGSEQKIQIPVNSQRQIRFTASVSDSNTTQQEARKPTDASKAEVTAGELQSMVSSVATLPKDRLKIMEKMKKQQGESHTNTN